MTSRKKLLLVSPSFFGYERSIASAFRTAGHDVTFVDERPSNGSLSRAVLRVGASVVRRRVDAYFREVDARLQAIQFDVVVIIKAEVVPEWFVRRLKERSPNAHLVFYTFDSIANAPNCVGLLSLFDRCWSFDPDDVRHDPRLSYLPLFFTEEFVAAPKTARPHDISFVGTLHSGRFQAVTKLFASFERPFSFVYVQARWYLRYQQLRDRSLRGVRPADVSFEKMDRAEVARVFGDSRCVLDIQRTGQRGMTMRTFEVLASGAILATTNEHIKDAPFYDPRRVVILPSDVSTWNGEAIARTLASMPTPGDVPDGFEQYALASWVSKLLSRC